MCCDSIYTLCKISGKNNRDITEEKYQKCLNDCVVVKESDCIIDMLDHVFSFKGEAKKVNNKIVDNILFMIALNGSGFDSFVVLNNLPQRQSVDK